MSRELPILFNGEMVRAILDGRKTQTRRQVKASRGRELDVRVHSDGVVEPCEFWGREPEFVFEVKPPYAPGDLLYVRETVALLWPDEHPPERDDDYTVEYRADGDPNRLPGEWPAEFKGDAERPKWIPSIHMPKWAARIWLRVTSVRVERVQDISHDDAIAEGIHRLVGGYVNKSEPDPDNALDWWCDPIGAFASLWSAAYPGSWDRNDWVWVYEFERVER